MRIIVTGANGQLGREITTFYRDNGCEVHPFSSSEFDITKYPVVSSLTRKIKPDLIINCAAYNAVDTAETDWEQAFSVNGLGPRYLARAASENGASIVHYSTDYIFNGKQNRPYTLADNPDPISRYGESKLLGEQMIKRHASEYYLIRTSWVFGSGNTNFVKKVLEWSKERDTITIVDDQVSSPTCTKDLAKATFDLTKSKEFGLFHITNSGSCSRFEWATDILKKTGWKGTILPTKSENFPTPAKRPLYSVLDNFGTKEAIGYHLPSWQDATTSLLQERKELEP